MCVSSTTYMCDATTEDSVVLILGYFFMHNIGDDLYCNIWSYLMNRRYASDSFDFQLESLEHAPDTIATKWVSKYGTKLPKCIILGGGDVVTEYFIVRMRALLHALALENQGWYDVPIHGVSVAMPYPMIVNIGGCDFFSSMLVRPSKYIEHLQTRIGADNVHRIPDLSCFLLTMYPDSSRIVQAALRCEQQERAGYRGRFSKHRGTSEVVAVCLAAQTCGLGHAAYDANMDSLARAVEGFQGRLGCHVVFMPFDTHGGKSDDRKVIGDLLSRIAPATRKACSLLYLGAAHTAENVFRRLQGSDIRVVLCMRYHAHMIATLALVPIASIAVTQKVKSMMEELQVDSLPCTYTPTLDAVNVPVAFDAQAIDNAVTWTWHNTSTVFKHQARFVRRVVSHEIPRIDALMKRLVLAGERRSNATTIRHITMSSETAEQCLRRVLRHYLPSVDEDSLDAILRRLDGSAQPASLGDILREHGVDADADFVASMICTYVSNDMYPPYFYGLSQKVLSALRIQEDIKWIVEDLAKQLAAANTNAPSAVVNRAPMFRCRGMSRVSLQGLHRAGWQYVLQNARNLHANDDTLPIFDDYVDGTFNWMHDVLAALDIVPYKSAWFGFLHHSTTGSNNLMSVFENPSFIASLRHCRVLLTMSRYTATLVRQLLRRVGFGNVPVRSLVHPTDFPDICFTMRGFLANRQRALVQIGCWYRSAYAIYALQLADPAFVRKAAVRGKNMDNIFPPATLHVEAWSDEPPLRAHAEISRSDDAVTAVLTEGCETPMDGCVGTICRPMCGPCGSSAYMRGLIQNVIDQYSSVDVIQRLDDTQYDEMMASNIVFLNLEDASAVNTIIECVVRNTPLLVNPLPAVVEVLGADYPFYYANLAEAGQLACDVQRIRQTHNYLKGMDKTPFRIECFMQQFIDIIATV